MVIFKLFVNLTGLVLWLNVLQIVCYKNKPLVTQLTTDWVASPLILEASEFILKYQPDDYWNFINECSDKFDKFKLCHVDEYNEIVDIMSKYLPTELSYLFSIVMSRHDLAPRIHLYQKIVDYYGVDPECNEIFVVNNKYNCYLNNINKLTEILDNPKNDKIFDTIFENNLPLYKNNFTENKIIIYYFGHIGTKKFWDIYNKLINLVKSSTNLNFIVIPYTKTKCSMNVGLSNYGMSLSIKKNQYELQNDTLIDLIEYKDNSILSKWLQVDEYKEGESNFDPSFNISKLFEIYPKYADELRKLEKNITEESDPLIQLEPKEINDLALSFLSKLPQFRTIDELNTIIAHFPTYAKQLSQQKILDSVEDSVDNFINYLKDNGISNGVYLNGQVLESLTDKKFEQLLFNEIKTAILLSTYTNNTHLNGMGEMQWNRLLESYVKNVFETKRLNIKSSTVMWLNDLENDSIYSYWPKQLIYLFQLSFTGQLPSVSLNAYNLIAVIDVMDKDISNILETMIQLLEARVAIRFGIVLNVNKTNKLANMISSGFYFLATKNSKHAARFLLDVIGMKNPINLGSIRSIFKKYSKLDIVNINENSDIVNDRINDIRMDIQELGIAGCHSSFFLNGKMINLVNMDESVGRVIINYVFKEMLSLYQKFISKRFPNVGKLISYNETFVNRMNLGLLNSPNFLNDVKFLANKTYMLSLLEKVENRIAVFYINYTENKSDSQLGNILVFINLNSISGRILLKNMLKHRSKVVQSGLFTFVFNCHHKQLPMLQQLMEIINHYSRDQTLNIDDDITTLFDSYPTEIKDCTDHTCLVTDPNFYHKFMLNNTDNAIIWFNKIYHITDIKKFAVEDIDLILEMSKIPKTYNTHGNATNTKSIFDDTLSVWFGVIMGTYIRNKRYGSSLYEVASKFPQFTTSFDINKKCENCFIDYFTPHIVVVLDPLTENSQKIISQLTSIHASFPIKISFVMVPTLNLEDLPIKSYYQWCLPPYILFDNDTGYMLPPSISFKDLAIDPLYTSFMQFSSSWMVENVYSDCDMDNIYLKITNDGCYAIYQLKYILIEGASWLEKFISPSSGIQYILEDMNNKHYSDTLVMNNLGYLQLKSTVGIYKIVPKKSSSYSYVIDKIVSDSKPIEFITVDNFEGITVEIMVSKNEHVINQDSYENTDDDSHGGLWSHISEFFLPNDNKHKKSNNDTINVFSVATGSMYERFIRVMMLSVMKHTTKPVKFWLLRNYLSANFIGSLNVMANKYKFDYELVQYQWPKWLNDQKEKRRTIWGYKILFLDLLFPLDIKRVIFVDADQVVRSDLDALNKMDLGNAPYAYTPFCNDRHEIDHLRFWLTGYWRNLLRGKPYHISALYVVDLVKFRKMAVGDRLRAHYQSLSEDPNSLSNLDQDLPNSMMHEIPIKSLPQEWLWCETWCSDATKKYAKSIDLCGNPVTHEPKWKSAHRIIPEFADYDNEIENLLHPVNITQNNINMEQEL